MSTIKKPITLTNAFRMTLIHYRSLREMSQETLAKNSGLTRQYISRLESGNQHPGLDALSRLLNALDQSFSSFGKDLDKALLEQRKNSSKMAADKKGPFWDEK